MTMPNGVAIHRQRTGRPQQWLAKQLGTSVMEIDALERGIVPLTEIQAARIAKILRIPPYHVVGGMCDCEPTYQEPVYDKPKAHPPRRKF